MYDITSTIQLTNPILRPDNADIANQWGAEKATNFIRYNDDSGYNYLSYMPSIYISKDSVYSLQVRGYVPTVKFLSGVRITGKNWTDFGYVSIDTIIS